ncbi:hypothetical protein BGZ76_008554 [Entomortierella beljakovae]|nr:hypothetical protein BGZ76_008554 [Entomortierella beljakovae]
MGLQQQHVPTDSIDINNNTDDVTTTIPDYHQVCTCTCTQHRRAGSDGRLSLSSASFKKRKEKELRESRRGYPTGQCISTTTPPEGTNWDEKDSDLLQTHPRNTTKNTAFNLEALKAFLNSPLFSNFLKSYTIMASASLFAISLSSLILAKNAQDDNQQQQQHSDQLSNGNAALIVIVTLSLMTILYSCFTIFLESRRPPEGLDSSNSKPLIVIFSEIIASIIWSQLLGITIYIYIWTYGCTTESRIQIQTIWKLNQADNELTDKLCRRQAAMVGLELLLVLLLIFNFYTHLAQNFKFIRAVS